MRWLLSTVPSAMIFDDHDVIDDWNTSRTWIDEIRANGWWDEPHRRRASCRTGSTSTSATSRRTTLAERRHWRAVHRGEGDAAQMLREFAWRADREVGRHALELLPRHRPHAAGDDRLARRAGARPRASARWSTTTSGTGSASTSTGDVDHLLIGTSLPLVLLARAAPPGGLERGDLRRRLGAGRRAGSARSCAEALDLEHWARVRRLLPQADRAARRGRRRPARRAAGDDRRCCPATSTTPTWPRSASPGRGVRLARSTRRSARRSATRSTRTSGARSRSRPQAARGASRARTGPAGGRAATRRSAGGWPTRSRSSTTRSRRSASRAATRPARHREGRGRQTTAPRLRRVLEPHWPDTLCVRGT